MDRPSRTAQCLTKLSESIWILVVPINVPKQLLQLCKGGLINAATVVRQTIAGPVFELIERPACFRDADDGNVQVPLTDHCLQSREDFLMGQISGRPEKHK